MPQIPSVPIPLRLLAEMTGKPISVLRRWTHSKTSKTWSVTLNRVIVKTTPPKMKTVKLKGSVFVEPSEIERMVNDKMIEIKDIIISPES